MQAHFFLFILLYDSSVVCDLRISIVLQNISFVEEHGCVMKIKSNIQGCAVHTQYCSMVSYSTQCSNTNKRTGMKDFFSSKPLSTNVHI